MFAKHRETMNTRKMLVVDDVMRRLRNRTSSFANGRGSVLTGRAF